MKRVLIYGFGRMGLTHFSILNGLNTNLNFSVVEPNKILRKILNKNINLNKSFPSESTIDFTFLV